MSLKAPCLNCNDRHVHCHSNCKLYMDFKLKNDKIREEKYKINKLVYDLYYLKKEKNKKLKRR